MSSFTRCRDGRISCVTDRRCTLPVRGHGAIRVKEKGRRKTARPTIQAATNSPLRYKLMQAPRPGHCGHGARHADGGEEVRDSGAPNGGRSGMRQDFCSTHWTARRTTSMKLPAINLDLMCIRWISTVFSLMPIFLAICFVEYACPIR